MTDKYRHKARAANERWRQQRDCEAKRTYLSEEAAVTCLPENQYVYDCPWCPYWHRATDKSKKALR